MLRGLYVAGALLAISLPAHAGNWTGCYGGVNVGYSTAQHELDVAAGGIVIDSLGADGKSYGVTGGCDMQVERLVFGVWGDHTWSDTEFSITTAGLPPLLETEIERSWAVGVRGGVVVGSALAYGLVGYTEAETSGLNSPAAAASLALPTLEGYVVGGGVELDLTNGLYLDLRYTYADYDEVNLAPLPASLDTDVQTARVGVLYRLNWNRDEFVIPAIDAPVAAAPTKHKPLK
jgi:opacity protein-like surface antigen